MAFHVLSLEILITIQQEFTQLDCRIPFLFAYLMITFTTLTILTPAVVHWHGKTLRIRFKNKNEWRLCSLSKVAFRVPFPTPTEQHAKNSVGQIFVENLWFSAF